MTFLVQQTLIYAIPLMIVALAGVFAERSGIINLALEGIMIFVEKALCDEMNIRIFVDADADVRLCRRIRRDVKKRGRSIDSVIDQYLTTVKPMHEAFVEPSKRNADIIIPNGGENGPAIEMLAHHIRSLIQKSNTL